MPPDGFEVMKLVGLLKASVFAATVQSRTGWKNCEALTTVSVELALVAEPAALNATTLKMPDIFVVTSGTS